MAFFIFLFSHGLARFLLPRTVIAPTEAPGRGPSQIQAIAFSVVGVALFVSAAPTLVFMIATLILGQSRSVRTDRISAFVPSVANFIRYGTEAALGMWLFFGSKGLAAWWLNLRHPEWRGEDGAPPIAEPEKAEETPR
jgi:hypothetical protein